MKRVILSFIAVLITITALANGPEYFIHVKGLFDQGKYEEAIQGFEVCTWLYSDELPTQNMAEWIAKCNKGIEDKKAAAAARRARAAAAERAAYDAKQRAREENKLVYISSDALNINGVEFDLTSVIINNVQKQTKLLFTNNPDDAYYYAYVTAISRRHNFDNGLYYSNVVANVKITDMKDVIYFANRVEETQASTLSYEKATDLCYGLIGNEIGDSVSERIGGAVIASQHSDKKVIAVVAASNFINTSDLGFVELQFRNAFQKVGYEVKKPESGAIAELRKKAIAYQEAGNVSNSEAKHITEKTGAELLCVVVIDKNTSFNTYDLSASTIDLAKGTIVGLEASCSMQEENIHNQNAVLKAANELIKGMELTTDEVIISSLNNSITQYDKAYQSDVSRAVSTERERQKKEDVLYNQLKARAFVPGLAQLKDGATGLGVTFIAGATVCIGGIVVSQYLQNLYSSKLNSTHSATEKQRYAQMSNTFNVTTYISAAGAIGLYVWNIVDGLSRAKKTKRNWNLGANSTQGSYGITFAYTF